MGEVTLISNPLTLILTGQLQPPGNVTVSSYYYNNGTVQISWSRPLAVCSLRNISYNISLVPTYGNPMDEVSVTTEETRVTFHLTPGREYRASLITMNTDCSISSCAIQTVFTALQNHIPGNHINPSHSCVSLNIICIQITCKCMYMYI